MTWNWEGDRILQDTAIEHKRYVIGDKRPITTDIREWISFSDNIVMKEILGKLKDSYRLPTTKKEGDFDRRAMVVWRYVARKVRYVYDIRRYKKGDFWLFPPETHEIGRGDCEDGSFLLASLLIASGISPFCVRVVLGEVFDEADRSLGGHCWPVYKNERGIWCILESTLDKVPPRMPEADRLTEQGRPFRYSPLYCFNSHHLWEMAPGEVDGTRGEGIQRYLRARRKKADMGKIRRGR